MKICARPPEVLRHAELQILLRLLEAEQHSCSVRRKEQIGYRGVGLFLEEEGGGCSRDLVKMQGEEVEGEEKEEEDGDGTDSKGQPGWMAGKMKE